MLAIMAEPVSGERNLSAETGPLVQSITTSLGDLLNMHQEKHIRID